MRRLGRAAWNARRRRHHPGRLVASQVDGIAFHWPAVRSSRPVTKRAVPRALRSWQNYHMDGHGWSDIAYQVAIDQWGRVWELRGLENRSAANGNYALNSRFGAVLLVLVRGEEPTPAMLEAARAVVEQFRELFPGADRLVGHGDIRPGGTECPGPAVRRALAAGDFTPNRKDDVTVGVWDERIRNFDRQGGRSRRAWDWLMRTFNTSHRADVQLDQVERKLGRVERKLDRVLERLEK